MMGKRKTVGVLTFHRCINYGSYWQARCLVEGLRELGHDAVLLDQPQLAGSFEAVVVGSDEVWNFCHPWYADKPIFFGEELPAERLVAYGRASAITTPNADCRELRST